MKAVEEETKGGKTPPKTRHEVVELYTQQVEWVIRDKI